MTVRIRSSGTPMVPPIALTLGKGRTATRLLLGGVGIREATTKEQTAATKKPKTSAGLAGRWRWTATPWAADQTTLTGLRKAGPLMFEVQGIVAQTRSGYTQRSWVWSVQRRSDRKGTPPASASGRAKSYGEAVRAAYSAGIHLEGAVCGIRTVARNTRAGRTFETAARTTAQASKRKERVSSVELEPGRTKAVRKQAAPSSKSGNQVEKPGQKTTGRRSKRKPAASGQGRLF